MGYVAPSLRDSGKARKGLASPDEVSREDPTSYTRLCESFGGRESKTPTRKYGAWGTHRKIFPRRGRRKSLGVD